MKKSRYMVVLKMITLALDEVGFDPYNIQKNSDSFINGDSFINIVKQYGKRYSVTDEEVQYVINTPLKEIFLEGEIKMTRNLLIMTIEKRITELLDIRRHSKGMTDEGLPRPENSAAEYELRVLKEASKGLQYLTRDINP